MADRIIIINQGRITGQGTREDLRRQAGREGRARFAVKAAPAESETAIRRLPSVQECRLDAEDGGESHYLLQGPDERLIVEEAGALAQEKGWRVLELAAAPFSLEEIFLALTERRGGSGSPR